MYSPLLCQICMSIVYSQTELHVFKVIKLDVQIRPVFTDPVTNMQLNILNDHCTSIAVLSDMQLYVHTHAMYY